MPRKKLPPKFKYTTRKDDVLFVRLPVAGLKYPVWRKCETETQEGVNKIIAFIKEERVRELRENTIPTRCDKFFDFWLDLVK